MTETKEQPKKEIPAIEQWNHLAFQAIYKELAPKGFKKFTNGHWRGAEHADIPFLSKKQVVRTQKISAQLIRSYRDKVIEAITGYIENRNKNIDQWSGQLSKCRWHDLHEKRQLKEWIASGRATVAGLEIALFQITNIGIK